MISAGLGHPQIEDAQHAVLTSDVVRLDVAMDDLETMQDGDGLRQSDAQADGVRHGKVLPGVQAPLQRGARVPGHEVVEATARFAGHDLGECLGHHATGTPLLHQEIGNGGFVPFQNRLGS